MSPELSPGGAGDEPPWEPAPGLFPFPAPPGAPGRLTAARASPTLPLPPHGAGPGLPHSGVSHLLPGWVPPAATAPRGLLSTGQGACPPGNVAWSPGWSTSPGLTAGVWVPSGPRRGRGKRVHLCARAHVATGHSVGSRTRPEEGRADPRLESALHPPSGGREGVQGVRVRSDLRFFYFKHISPLARC